MTLDELPKNDIVYIKFNRRQGIFSCPLCEIVDGKILENYTIELNGSTKKYTKGMLMSLIQKRLDSGTVVDFVLQKQDTPLSDDVNNFITKYSIK